MEKVYKKLVRDNIPSIIAAENKFSTISCEKLKGEKLWDATLTKFCEEVGELREAGILKDAHIPETKKNVVNELADLYELIKFSGSLFGITMTEVEIAAKIKAEKRGSFNNGVMLNVVRTDEPDTATFTKDFMYNLP